MVSLIVLGLVFATALHQIFAPEAAPILEIVAMLLPVLNRYITEFIKAKRPDLEGKLGSYQIARNVGFVVFAAFAVIGLVSRPEFVIPAVPSAFDAIDWLEWLASLLAAGGMILYYTIRGSNDVHDRITGGKRPIEL